MAKNQKNTEVPDTVDGLPEVRQAEIGLDLYRGSGLVGGRECTPEDAADLGLTADEIAFVFHDR